MGAESLPGDAQPGRSATTTPIYQPPAGLSSVLERNIQALQLRRQREQQEATTQERLADAITRFTGSMRFLDRDLRIRRFTPRLLEIFNLREGDEGRPIADIVTHLTRDGLGRDVQQVLRSLIPIEREVMIAEGRIVI